MDNLPSLKKLGEKLDLLKKLKDEGHDEQAEALAQNIFENYAFARDNCLRMEDNLIATRNTITELESNNRNLEQKLKETLAAYNSDFRTFQRFSNAQTYVNNLKSVSALPDILGQIASELGAYKISIVLDRDTCSGLPLDGIPTFHLKGCMRYIDATLCKEKNRIFIGPISKMMRPDIFFGDPDMSPENGGSCFAFGLMDKYHPERMIGLLSFYDPSVERYHPEMGTDYLEHFCSSLASAVTDVITHQKSELLHQDVDRITRHDLKTPLNAVINLPHLLLASETDHSRKEMIKSIQDSGYKMLALINRSYDIYRMESGSYVLKPEKVDMLPMVGQIRMDLLDRIESKRLELVITVNGQAPDGAAVFFVQGEELLLFSMLANLLKNSVEAAPENSSVNIAFSDSEGATVRIHNLGEVPPAIRDIFFEKYSTAGKAEGTGLGTYSAKLIANVHGGDIKMETSAVNGTTVTVTL